MLYTATCMNAPAAVRYPRGQGPGVTPVAEMAALPVGKAEVRREGHSGLLLLGFGSMVRAAELIGERLDATVVNMRFIKPLDEELVLRLARGHEVLITVEEGTIGGFGSHVVQLLAERGCLDDGLAFRSLVLPDTFIDHDKPERMYARAGLDSQAIIAKVFEVLGKDVSARMTQRA
jgi:1-deoxy-D-xylulose-5-phosphate synthase